MENLKKVAEALGITVEELIELLKQLGDWLRKNLTVNNVMRALGVVANVATLVINVLTVGVVGLLIQGSAVNNLVRAGGASAIATIIAALTLVMRGQLALEKTLLTVISSDDHLDFHRFRNRRSADGPDSVTDSYSGRWRSSLGHRMDYWDRFDRFSVAVTIVRTNMWGQPR